MRFTQEELDAKLRDNPDLAIASNKPTSVPETRQLAHAKAGCGIILAEVEFQSVIIDYAHLRGWTVAHFRKARIKKQGSDTWVTPVGADGKGFPDLILVRERVVWIEVKSEKGKLSEEQRIWYNLLKDSGQEVYVIRPSDWDSVLEILE